MRQSRFKVLPDEPVAYYHVVGRSVDPRFVFAEDEKDRFQKLLRQCEVHCSVKVLTYCLVPGVFHLLLEVPQHPGTVADDDLRTRLDGLFSSAFRKVMEDRWKTLPAEQAKKEFRAYASRFWDLSWFVRFLKQPFAQWYNGKVGRRGTLWEERFRSSIVEGTPEVLSVVAAYIDLACVRAGLVDDPGTYKWCGFGEACAGVPVALEGIQGLMTGTKGPKRTPNAALKAYTSLIYGDDKAKAAADLATLTPERIAYVLENNVKLPLTQYLRCEVRYFDDGTIVGSKAFVDKIFEEHRWRFSARRKDGARRMRWVDGLELYSARQLMVDVIEAPVPLAKSGTAAGSTAGRGRS